jgi:outer membrane protein assembly factor BamB
VTGAFDPMSLTSTALIVPDGNLVALNPADGAVLWSRKDYGLFSGVATFGDLAWFDVDNTSGYFWDAASRTTGRNAYSNSIQNSDQRLPPVTDDGRVFVNLGGEILCLALPS